ncbi:MAG: Uncharacterized protein XD63_0317 [Thermoanaerobacterales bacterium 50_218]|nr:MAG: Uncharacterized protein XD63_0317 [Thermoanaerobacterales bacterium 50_218]HAA90605.1 hypothetical protein [Peptococcaceae bacterium]
MGIFDALFGWTRQPRAQTDPLFALTTAMITMETELGWIPTGKAGLCLKPPSTGDFRMTEKELEELLNLAARETESKVMIKTDEFNYKWLLFEDPDWEDLVTLIHLAGEKLTEEGYGSQLLAAVFSFKQEEQADDRILYLIYNYKRGKFYPFLPVRGRQDRDTSEEMKICALMEKELPWEKNLSYWYPIWGCPL